MWFDLCWLLCVMLKLKASVIGKCISSRCSWWPFRQVAWPDLDSTKVADKSDDTRSQVPRAWFSRRPFRKGPWWHMVQTTRQERGHMSPRTLRGLGQRPPLSVSVRGGEGSSLSVVQSHLLVYLRVHVCVWGSGPVICKAAAKRNLVAEWAFSAVRKKILYKCLVFLTLLWDFIVFSLLSRRIVESWQSEWSRWSPTSRINACY